MTEPAYLHDIRTSYDTVAESYAEIVPPSFEKWTMGRALLAAFAELVNTEGGGAPVVDMGCGPGHVTARLHALGVDAYGVDLSPGMIEVARRNHPELRFEVGSMTEPLDLPDDGLGGVLALYSFIHLPSDVLPAVFAEFHRVLTPGGHLMLGFHVGDTSVRKKSGYGGHPMSIDVHRMLPDRIADVVTQAGLLEHTRVVEQPELGNERSSATACLLFRKPGSPTRP